MTNTCAQCGRIYDPEKPHDCADRTAFTHGIVHGDEDEYALPPLADFLRDATPTRCNVRLVAVAPPHDRCISADWPDHHHVFGVLP